MDTSVTPMTYPVSYISLKIQRADQHIDQCRAALREFIASQPYEIVRQANLKAGKVVYTVEKADPVPLPISIYFGDALQNLRTTLDYLAHALVVANKHTPTEETSFPILRGNIDSEKFKPTFERKVQGMRDDAVEKIKGLKPYKGGDDLLYPLHALNNRDKHRLLLTAGSAVSRLISQPWFRPGVAFERLKMPALIPEEIDNALNRTFIGIPGIFPLNKGQEILVDPPHAESHENVTLFGEVAINEPEIIEPVPLIVFLRRCRRRVWKICVDFAYLIR